MAKSKSKPRRRIWRTLGISLLVVGLLLFMFVSAFVFNPFEGSVVELRDVVPRGVNFFVHKERLADDFAEFPEPRFWAELAEAPGFRGLQEGALGQRWKREGLDRSVQQAREAVAQLREQSGGNLDLLRDVLGKEVMFAGYEQDYSQQPARPLAEPWWCFYARVSWRVKALHGLAGFGLVQGQLQKNGVDVSNDGERLVVKLPGLQSPLYIDRHLDLLMVGNHPRLLDQGRQLLLGSRDEEPIGVMAAYVDGAQKRIARWVDVHGLEQANAIDFVLEPNAFDGFRRFAAGWPNRNAKDSMNERVLASFLNLRGWQVLTGAFLFGKDSLVATGQVELNSKEHSAFQSSFYKAEQAPRQRWLDPFLGMVPESACAAAALRMPAGEFLHAMFDALEEDEKTLIDDAMRRVTFQGTQLTDMRDLIGRLQLALLPRTGFVFRKNEPDMSRDENGRLMVPVTAKSPVPQVAWVFWLQPRAQPLLEELVTMLRTNYQTFRFQNVWHLPVRFGNQRLQEPVTEFTQPLIPGTGELAMIVFNDFFVLSNSGPLVRDILRTKYSQVTGARSLRDSDEWRAFEGDPDRSELANSLNGLVWVDGQKVLPLIDDYIGFADSSSEQADPVWMMENRPAAEETVRRTQFARYPSKASMERSMTEPGGEFEVAVTNYLRQQWQQARTSFTADDRAQMQQLRSFAQMLRSACLQLELENNYIRFQARVVPMLR